MVLNDTNGLATTLNNLNVQPYLTGGMNLIAVKAHDGQGGQGLTMNLDVDNVPEPSIWALALIGFGGLLGYRRRAKPSSAK